MFNRSSVCVYLLTALALPWSASAQISPSGGTIPIVAGAVRGSSVAYDSKNNVYLAVGAYGSVSGRFVRPDGSFASAPFTISTTGAFAHFPRAAYSPHANGGQGAFLVAWHENTGASNFVHARMVSVSVGLLGTELILGNEPTWWEAAPAIAYSTVSQNFLVVWQTNHRVRGARVSAAGGLIDGNLVITDGFDGGGERDPSIAYNPATNQYLVAYTGWASVGAHASARLVSAASGAMTAPQYLSTGTGTYISDASFSPSAGQYLVAWYQLPNGGLVGRTVDANGTPTGSVTPLSSRFGTYDSVGLAYNPVSNTHLMVGQDLLSAENGAVEISGAGAPISEGVMTNAGGSVGNFYPKVASHTTAKQWMLSTAHDFARLDGQLIVSGSSGGGAPPPPGPAPVQITSFSSNVALPTTEGTSITWTVNSTGGTSPIHYQFWRYSTTTGWIVGQDYSTANTFTWAPPAGTHAVQAWARSAGSSAAYEAYTGTGNFDVTGGAAQITSLNANVAFPVASGVPITWTATASGGTTPHHFRFWRYSTATGWVLAQDYSTTNTFTWTPPQGTNAIQVWVRSAGSSAVYESWSGSGSFTVLASLASGPAQVLDLTANVSFPAPPTATITWTASASGSGTVEYKFWGYNSATNSWFVVRDWEPNNQASWTPGAAGQFALQVWVRNVGSSATFEDWRGTSYFSLTFSTSLTLSADRSLTSLHNNETVNFTAQVSGGTGPWEYQFWTYNGTSWVVAQPYPSGQNTFSWVASTGTRAVQVWVRSAGSNHAWERWAGTPLFIVNP